VTTYLLVLAPDGPRLRVTATSGAAPAAIAPPAPGDDLVRHLLERVPGWARALSDWAATIRAGRPAHTGLPVGGEVLLLWGVPRPDGLVSCALSGGAGHPSAGPRRPAAEGAPMPPVLLEEMRRLDRVVFRASIVAGTLVPHEVQADADGLLPDGVAPLEARDRWLAAVHPEDRRLLDAHLARLAAGAAWDAVEYRVARPDGAERWVRSTVVGEPREDGVVELRGLVRDVTDERRARSDLRTLLDTVAEVVLEFAEPAPGRLVAVDANRAAGALAGSGEPGGAAATVAVAGLTDASVDALRAAAVRLRAGEPAVAVALVHRAGGGGERTLAGTLVPGASGTVVAVLSDLGPAGPPGDGEAGPRLTPRQLDVLRLLAQGVRSDEIARRLGISPVTVANHAAGALRRLGARSRIEAVYLARGAGLLDDAAG
jgi:DNA-binding CsgD family transcriptional regulator